MRAQNNTFMGILALSYANFVCYGGIGSLFNWKAVQLLGVAHMHYTGPVLLKAEFIRPAC